jgi:proteasome lid subunit RPN8/RPN11
MSETEGIKRLVYKDPTVAITTKARATIIAYAKEMGNCEICGLLFGDFDSATLAFKIDEVIIAYQKASYAQCTIKMDDTWPSLTKDQQKRMIGYW